VSRAKLQDRRKFTLIDEVVKPNGHIYHRQFNNNNNNNITKTSIAIIIGTETITIGTTIRITIVKTYDSVSQFVQ